MSYKIALVGLPNVGKSSIFNFLSSQLKSTVAPYPFSTINPVKSVVYFPDSKLDEIHKLFLWWFRDSLEPSQLIKKNSSFELWDIAGIVPLDGTVDKTSELGPSFLSHIRATDLILLVVRVFKSPTVNSSLDSFLEEHSGAETILSCLEPPCQLEQPEKKLSKTKELFKQQGLSSDILSGSETNLSSTLDVQKAWDKDEVFKKFSKPTNYSESILESLLVLITLIQSDLEILYKTIQKYSKNLKINEKQLKILSSIKTELEKRKYIPISSLDSYKNLSSQEREIVNNLSLLTSKKIVLLANYGSSKESLENLLEFKEWAIKNSLSFCSLNLEAEEICSLLNSEEEKREARESIYLKHSSKDELFNTIKQLFKLSSFYTFKLEDKVGRKYSLTNWNWKIEPVSGEVRAWLFSSLEENNYLWKCVSSIHNQLSDCFISSKLITSDKFLKLSPIQEFSNELVTASKNYQLQGGEIVQVIASV